jgi:Protein of unknown function (DUF3732)
VPETGSQPEDGDALPRDKAPSDVVRSTVSRDKDIGAVQAVFVAIAEEVISAKGTMQVIILDHAGPDIWSGIKGVILVEEWRQGDALVPQAWLS